MMKSSTPRRTRGKRRLLLTAVLAAVTVSASGCVFLPSLAGGDVPPTEAPSKTENAADDGIGSDREGTTPAPRGTAAPDREREESSDPETVDDWPEEIPKPPGEPSPYSDTAEFYLVPADRETFDAYVEELLSLADVEERDTSDSSYDIAWLFIGDYDVFVMFHDDSDQLSVTITPRH